MHTWCGIKQECAHEPLPPICIGPQMLMLCTAAKFRLTCSLVRIFQQVVANNIYSCGAMNREF